MTNQSDDRRSRRSRRMLKQGLLNLMQRKRFTDISVRDITDLMDMNRGTFYLHYSDTAELLQSLEEDLLGEAQALIDAHLDETLNDRSLRPLLEPILDFVVANRETCTILFNNNDASGFTTRLQQLIRTYGAEMARTWFHFDDPEQLDYQLSFVTYGLLGLVTEWFTQNMALPKETLLEMADRLLNGVIAALPVPAAPHS